MNSAGHTGTCAIALLGETRVEINSHAIAFQSRYRKALGLLAYLAAECHKAHSRDFLAALFWPELDEAAARNNLRQVLSHLNRLLHTPGWGSPLWADRQAIRLQPASWLHLDLLKLERMNNHAQPQTDTRTFEPVSNNALLTGEFLSAYSLPGCDEFELWLLQKREFYRLQQLSILQTHVAALRTERRFQQALEYASALQQLDSDNEQYLRLNMQLYAESGQISMALKVFDHFSQRLFRELDSLPDAATLALRDQLTSRLHTHSLEQPAISPQFPAIQQVSLVVVMRVQWASSGQDQEASAQAQFDFDLSTRQLLCEQLGAFSLDTLGKGAFFYFGWPQAVEDPAWLAVRAALLLQARATQQSCIRLKIGIHAGRLLSSLDTRQPDLVGDITEETFALCSNAQHEQILISESIKQLLGDRMRVRKLHDRRRVSDGNLHAVYEVHEMPTWLDQAFHTRLLGRDALQTQLEAIWNSVVHDSICQLTQIIAPAGTGKSALITHQLATLRERSAFLLKLTCYPDQQQNAFAPLHQAVRQLLGLPLLLPLESAQIQERLHLHGWSATCHDSALIDWLGDEPNTQAAPSIDLSLQRFLAQIAAPHQALILWLEDAHWADMHTAAFLKQLHAQASPIHWLVISGRRPLPAFADPIHYPALSLPALDTPNAHLLLSQLDGHHQRWRSEEQARALIRAAEGNPLLLQQLSQDATTLPDALLNLYNPVLQQLGSSRELALVLSVAGTQTEPALLERLRDTLMPGLCLTTGIEQLLQNGILQRTNRLCFTSPLLQQVLYELNPPSRVHYIHRSLFLALEQMQRNGSAITADRLDYHRRGAMNDSIIAWQTERLFDAD